MSVTANKRITSEKKITLATLIGTNPVKRNLHLEGVKIQLTGFSSIRGLAKIRKLFNLSALALGMAIPEAAFAGAWTAKQGESYIKEAVNYFESDSRFGPENGFENFRNVNYTLYWEHGVEDNLTFFTQGAFVKTRNTDSGVTTFGSGISDIDLGLRYKLNDGPVVVSVQGLFKAPYLYDENAELPIGNGQEDFEGKLLFGKSFDALGYGGVEVGYRLRAEAPADEFRYVVEYGIDLNERSYVRAKLDGVHSVGGFKATSSANAPIATGAGLNPQLPNRFNVGRLEYTFGYKISRSLSGEIAGTSAVYGNNTLKGTNIQVALVASF